jgi:hypothetical protein
MTEGLRTTSRPVASIQWHFRAMQALSTTWSILSKRRSTAFSFWVVGLGLPAVFSYDRVFRAQYADVRSTLLVPLSPMKSILEI